MKLLIAALVSSFFGFNAFGQVSKEIYRAQLNEFRVDPQVKTLGEVNRGHIDLNLDRQEATLALFPAFRCPPQAFCAQVMPAPIFITLPIVDRIEDECGTRIWIAERDNTEIGGLERIEIRDNSGFKCDQEANLPETVVILNIETATEKTRSFFSGESFLRMNQPSWHRTERRDVEGWSTVRQGGF